jgi:hypothetical protein
MSKSVHPEVFAASMRTSERYRRRIVDLELERNLLLDELAMLEQELRDANAHRIMAVNMITFAATGSGWLEGIDDIEEELG